MIFRPCIDIHNGKVKQIVGSSLKDQNDQAWENYVSKENASYYAKLYQSDGLLGGHVILLNPIDSPYYQETKKEAVRALEAYPGGLQVGGGIQSENARFYLEHGASHVIVTSYVFQGGEIRYDHLEKLKDTVGKKRIVLDLSCRKKDGKYYIVTDRWQKFTNAIIKPALLELLSQYCDEFLIHAVDVEGKNRGIEEELSEFLGSYSPIKTTYAGGVHSMEDLEKLEYLGKGRVDVTIGSGLDLFGGKLSYKDICRKYGKQISEWGKG